MVHDDIEDTLENIEYELSKASKASLDGNAVLCDRAIVRALDYTTEQKTLREQNNEPV